MRRAPKKTCEQIVASGNHYLGALKGNHGNFFKAIQSSFQLEEHFHLVETGHGRVERRTVSLCRNLGLFPQVHQWPGLRTIIKVTSYRHLFRGQYLLIKEPAIRYYISSLEELVEAFARRIREHWQVEYKVHYVRDVTQGEDASRIRVQLCRTTLPLPLI